MGKIFDGISYPLFLLVEYSESERKLAHTLMDLESESKNELPHCHSRICFKYVGTSSPCKGKSNRNESVKVFQSTNKGEVACHLFLLLTYLKVKVTKYFTIINTVYQKGKSLTIKKGSASYLKKSPHFQKHLKLFLKQPVSTLVH